MKRERELKIADNWLNPSGQSCLLLDDEYDVKNIKVILTKDIAEYYELLTDGSYSICNAGDILKLYKFDDQDKKCPYLLSTKCGLKLWFVEKEVKPSTKKAYKAQFTVVKPKELEVEEYYEVLVDSSFGAYKAGNILKLSEFDSGKTEYPYRLTTKDRNSYWFTKNDVKPSTKKEYEAQFKAKKLTVAEIEEKLGYKIKIIT